MMISTSHFIICIIVGTVHSLHVLSRFSSHIADNSKVESQRSLRRVLEALASTKLYLTSGSRKTLDPMEIAKAKHVFDSISKSVKLRNHENGKDTVPVAIEHEEPDMDHQQLIENELEETMSKHTSALLNNAYVQKKGRNDFLVLEDEAKDPFVTVIPNNIYYNIEKKCVNWLDDCSLQGIRSRLLQKVKGPFK